MKIIGAIFMWLAMLSAQAQDTPKSDTVATSYLNEVIVSANKTPEQRKEVAQQLVVIQPSVIKSYNAQTTADLLQNTGAVAMQRSQQGGGSPILRGFEASMVLWW